jgi:PPOX class probable F420-dependent enzyme
MAKKMTSDECRWFLVEKARTAKVSTVRPDGRPHVAAVWFELDGDTILFTTGEDTVKAANMRHQPIVSIIVDDERPPFAYVQVEGRAELAANDPDLLHWATRIGGRYMGADQAERYGRRNAVEGELLVRVHITKMIGTKDVAGW